jgi:hypothetical protein
MIIARAAKRVYFLTKINAPIIFQNVDYAKMNKSTLANNAIQNIF